MSEIVDFLLARLAEDEDHAWLRMHHAQQNHLMLQEPNLLGRRIPGWHEWPEIEAWAARVLAEVEAKRRIVERHQMVSTYFGVFDATMVSCRICSTLEEDAPCVDLRLLALPYADHEHYRQEWRP